MMGALMDLHNPDGTAPKSVVFAKNLSKMFWESSQSATSWRF
jgi:hypothetical protein